MIKKKKMGRPTASPKNRMFRVRLDQSTLKKIEIMAEEMKITKSEVVRNGIEIQFKQFEKRRNKE